ncbi:hypothetical protein SDC9_113609 [bioreactor metagenome]|uniref:Uncharacterized protein n=1 Tax=bioreactor metagenome TaxID=1076179 RepID=A0A645BNL1_9ZZZZ
MSTNPMTKKLNITGRNILSEPFLSFIIYIGILYKAPKMGVYIPILNVSMA